MGIRGLFQNTVEAIRRFFGSPSGDDEASMEIEPLDDAEASQAIKEPFWLDGTTDSSSEETAPQPVEPIVAQEPFWLDGITDSSSEETAPLSERPIVQEEPFWLDGTIDSSSERIDPPPVEPIVPNEDVIASEQSDPALADLTDDPKPKPKPTRSRRRRSKKPDAIIISVQPKPALPTADLKIANYPLGVIDEQTTDAIIITATPKPVLSVVDLEVVNYPLTPIDEMLIHERLVAETLTDETIAYNGRPDAITILAQPKPVLPTVDLEIVNYPQSLADEPVSYSLSATGGAIPPQYLNGATPYEEQDDIAEEALFSTMTLEQPDESNIHLNGASSSEIMDGHLDDHLGENLLSLSEQAESMYIKSGGSQVSLESALESLLFVAETPIDLEHLTKILGLTAQEIKQGLETLDYTYAKSQRGLRIQDYEEKFQLVTTPSSASLVEDFLSFNLSTRLSGPALEALAIVAYRQPVTRAQVEAVRGVDCGSVLRSLIQLGLVEESGRLDALGRPILYSTTDFFMQHFGLLKMSDLPPLEVQEEETLLAHSTG